MRAVPPRARLLIVAVIVFVVALQSNAKRLQSALSRGGGSPGGDEVSLMLDELESAKRDFHFPGVVGFFSDDRRRMKGFFLTQYAVAPSLVEDEANHPFVIVFSANADVVSHVARTRGYAVVRVSTLGYSVLRRTAPAASKGAER